MVRGRSVSAAFVRSAAAPMRTAERLEDPMDPLARPNLIVLKKPVQKRSRRRRRTDWQKIAKRLQQAGRNFKWLGDYFERSALCIARDAKKHVVRR